MKHWLIALWLCDALLFQAAVQAQAVFVTQGEHGPVFSDKPQSGAKEVQLRPLSVIESVKEPRTSAGNASATQHRGDSPRAAAPPTRYQSLAILSPDEGGSVMINSGMVDVRLRADPSLQLGEGHAFVLSVNGRYVGPGFTSSEMTIPPEFWGATLPANQFAQLDASIVDAAGRELIRATPVRFFMRYTTVLNNPNHHHPLQIITPIRPIVPVRPPKPNADKATAARVSAGVISR